MTSQSNNETVNVPEPMWIRSPRGLVNLVFCSGIAVMGPRTGEPGYALFAHPVPGGRAIPIASRLSKEQVEKMLDRIASVAEAVEIVREEEGG